MQTVQIVDGQNKPITLVSGLEWHPLEENGLRRNGEIRQLAKNLRFDLKVVRAELDNPHAGYARTEEGAKLGFISLAACVCERLTKASSFGAAQHLLVALKLPIDSASNWAFVSSRDGTILADGDFAADEVTVRERIRSDAGYAMGWDAIICPASWEVPRSVHYDFDYFFETEQRALLSKLALTEIFVNNRLYWAVGAAVAAGLLVSGGMIYNKQKQEALNAEQAAIEAELAAQANQSKAPQGPQAKLVTPPPPMAAMDASIMSLAVKCDEALNGVNLSVGRWSVSRVECDNSGLSVAWSKGAGTISELVQAQPASLLSADGLTATLQLPVSGVEKPVEEVEQFWPRSAVAIGQKIRAESFGHEFKPGALSQPAAPAKGKPVLNTLAGLTFEATGHFSTPDLANLIDAPGVRAHRIVYTFTDGVQKTIHGVQYGK